MPTVDDELQRRIRRAAPDPPDSSAFEDIIRRKRRRSVTRRVGAVGVVVIILVGSFVAFAAVDRPNTSTPGASTPPPPIDDLGLPFATCRVSSMPASTELGGGTAYVFTKAPNDDCPNAGDGFSGVGIDITGDGVIDATSGPLPDCFTRCEAFAAPDVNADGVSEVAVSTEGADGYGVVLYSVTSTPPGIEPIVVSNMFGEGPQDREPLQFGWVDVYTHASSAGCDTTGDQGQFFALYSTEKLTPAQVQTTSILIGGSTATVTAISNDTMPLGEAPMPGTDLCGAPIYGSAAGLGAFATSTTCDVTTVSGDVDGDGTADILSIGTMATDDLSCPSEGTRILTIDLAADGPFDVRTGPPDCSTWCVPFALADLNGDGTAEILLNEGHLAPPVSAEIGVYELRDGMLQPVSFPDGKNRFPLQNSSQGYLGAYCSNPDTFWLWEGTTDQRGTLRSTAAAEYRLNVGALQLEETGQHGTTLNSVPAETGYDGRLCGADTQPLG
ncbi:MAG: VCBS repeat-containing protein [Actinomycetota bacterium]